MERGADHDRPIVGNPCELQLGGAMAGQCLYDETFIDDAEVFLVPERPSVKPRAQRFQWHAGECEAYDDGPGGRGEWIVFGILWDQ